VASFPHRQDRPSIHRLWGPSRSKQERVLRRPVNRYGVVRPDLTPERGWERGEGQDLGAGGIKVVVDLGQTTDVIEQLVVLGVRGVWQIPRRITR